MNDIYSSLMINDLINKIISTDNDKKVKQKQTRTKTKMNESLVIKITQSLSNYRTETNRKPLSTSSINTIINNISKLLSLLDNNMSKLKDIELVINTMIESDMKPNTIRNYLNSIIYLLQSINSQKEEDKQLIKTYEIIRDKLNEHYNKNKNNLTQSQEENIPTPKEMNMLIKKVKTDIDKDKLFQSDYNSLTDKEQKLIMFYLLINLYLEYPIRNDYYDMIIISKVNYNKLQDKSNKNYLVIDRTNQYLSIGRDKTIHNDSNTIRFFEIDKKPIRLLINKYLKCIGFNKNETQNLFMIKNRQLTSNDLTLLLQYFSNQYINKKISSTIFRKYHYINMKDKSIDNFSKSAYQNGHSINTANEIYNVKKVE